MRKKSLCALLIAAVVSIGCRSSNKTSATVQASGSATLQLKQLGALLDTYDRMRQEKTAMREKCEELQKNRPTLPKVFTDQAVFDNFIRSENERSTCWETHDALPYAEYQPILAALPYNYTWFVTTARGSRVAVAKTLESWCVVEYIADNPSHPVKVSRQYHILLVAPWDGNKNNLPALKQPEKLDCNKQSRTN